MTEVNTTASVKKSKTNAELAAETKKALDKFKNGKKVKVSIPTILKAQLGDTVYVAVNGVAVHVPVDGEEHPVPEPHAEQVKYMLKNLT